MAHTALRLGYISISGSGGGGISEYADLASFPPIGQSSVIYLALDTKKIYKWSGGSYIEISPSEVTSVNTKVGAVVLDKTDIGLGNVDNTSDLDKPISNDTQDALDALDDRIVPIEDRAEVVTVYAYENNALVYADGQPGIKDPSALIRDGWYFKNSVAGQKINWYYFDGTSQGTVTLGGLKSTYAVITFDAFSSAGAPIIAVYTFPTGTGDVIPGFAHSRIVYSAPVTPAPVIGKQYLIYTGENPPVHPELPRINLALNAGLSVGEKLSTEQILTVSFGSASGAAVNEVQYMVETLGLFSDPVKHEMDLRIRVASQLELDTHETNLSNPHQVTKTQVGLSNVDNTSDLDKPISNATQTALNALDTRLDPIEDRSLIDIIYAYENNASIYADGRPGIKDPSSFIRDGWYFQNATGQSINWYFFDGNPLSPTYQGAIQQANFNAYVVMTLDSKNARPIVGVYSLPTGTGDVIPGFAHSRWVYQLSAAALSPLVAGRKYLFYVGTNPAAHPELEHVELAYVPGASLGDRSPTELILTSSLNSEASSPAGNVQWMVESLGVWSTTIKQEMQLRIRVASQLALDSGLATKLNLAEKGAPNGVAPLNGSSKIDSTYLPSYVDDVEEYANLAAFPLVGETGKIYIALDTNLTYRWSGSVYVEISPAPVLSVNGQTQVVVLDSDDLTNQQATPAYWDIADGSTVKAHLDELASRREAQNILTKEPTGFATRDDSTTSFSDSGPDRTFTITPVGASFEFYVKGVKYTKTSAESIQIPNLAGNHFIYYSDTGVLSSTQVAGPALFQDYALVSIVYWNTDTNTHSYFAEERHGLQMDGATHSYLHQTFGARFISGLALENFTPDGDGSLEAHAQFDADEGTIRDEDLVLTSPVQLQIPILFRQGQLWRKKAADAYPLIYSGTAGYTGANGRIPYNQFLSGSWQLTEALTQNFVLVHFFATNDKETPIVGIQGIAEYTNIPAARIAASSEITSLSGLPFAEFVAIGSVIFQTNEAFTNIPNAVVRSVNGGSYVDFRGTQLYTPAGEATTHGLLSGLNNDDHIQYHTDARGDIRYYTKSQIDSFLAGLESPGDINEISYSFSNSQIVPESITNFLFSNAVVRSFKAAVSVSIGADSDLFEVFEINGIQKGSEWDLAISSTGDDTGISFSITSAGQVQYTSASYAGFVSGTFKIRATTTSV